MFERLLKRLTQLHVSILQSPHTLFARCRLLGEHLLVSLERSTFGSDACSQLRELGVGGALQLSLLISRCVLDLHVLGEDDDQQ